MKTLFKYVLAFAGAASLSILSVSADDCINKTCPFSGKEVDGTNSVEFVAKFCCGKCVDKFSGKAASKESKVTIAVCCGKCEKKGKADPKALLAKLQK